MISILSHGGRPVAILCAVLVLQGGSALGQGRTADVRRTTTVHWDRVPVGEALTRLSLTLGEPVFVDRRVDPERRISVQVENAATEAVLHEVAVAAGLGVSRIGGVIYFGPPDAAAQLRTLAAIGAERIKKLPPKIESAAKKRQPTEWPRLAQPRPLVTQLVEERGLRLAGGEKIPHDLWAASRLPELALADQLTLLLIGFDLMFDVDSASGTIEIVPLSEPLSITRRYKLPSALSTNDVQQHLHGINMRIRGDETVVVGTAEDHERVAELIRPQRATMDPKPAPAKTRKVYTLRIEQQPVKRVLEHLGQRLGWTIEIDEAALRTAGKSLEQRVSFSVQNVDEDELLRALLQRAGLHHERAGNRVRVFAQ